MFSFTNPHKYAKVRLETITRNPNCILSHFLEHKNTVEKYNFLPYS